MNPRVYVVNDLGAVAKWVGCVKAADIDGLVLDDLGTGIDQTLPQLVRVGDDEGGVALRAGGNRCSTPRCTATLASALAN